MSPFSSIASLKAGRLTSNCLEQPEGQIRFIVGREVNFSREAVKIFNGLGRNMIEIHYVTDCMEEREKQGCTGGDFMELDMRVQGDVLLDRELFQFCYQISVRK